MNRRTAHRWLRVLRTPMGRTAAVLVLIVLALAVVGPSPWNARADAVDTANILAGPSAEHWAGTDNLGRDIVFRVLAATRLSIGLALAATAVAVLAGLLLGTAPWLLGRRAGRLVTGVVQIAIAFPGLLLALFFAVVFGVGATGAVLAIGLAGAPTFARLVQTLLAGVASRDFVAAAQVAGVGRFRILLRHLLPNIAEPLVVNATIGAGGALLGFAGLSFLGLGVQAPAYDWGRLMFDGIGVMYVNPAAAIAPALAVLLAGLALNLLGESVAKGFGMDALVGLPASVNPSPAAPAAPAPPAPESAGDDASGDVVLDVRDLTVSFPAARGPIRPVRGVTFAIRRGEAVAVVGESGSGKSVTALAVSRLIDAAGRVDAERLHLLGTDLREPDSAVQRRMLGSSLAMVFQDPASSFNPTQRIGRQLAETSRHHHDLGRRAAFARAVDRLRAVRITDPERRARQYPHEFSGGMRQRAMIGMGLMGSPALIVADEPTTALDVTVQRQILELLTAIRTADDVALLLISHDVGVVSEVCDRVLVMYAGRIVEDLPTDRLGAALHPYTRALTAAVPRMDSPLDRPLPVIPGRPLDPADVPVGCAYADRCPLVSERCRAEDPPLERHPSGHRVACWHARPPLAGERHDDPARDGAAEPASVVETS
ncbi:dipeptide/oligopeptide/nickel ABC transporter permease/ATP-binding protein [Pseudosporangium ferrugineum]|uniref:Oligopeptide/dipeptide ABC transporter ATP-binding protein n=1 Tax=Pseudosporangium ferrugineum TaxID=439699 RepID=A0A2T0RJP4_9ACTN|nr:dipeptide/oligopeptide/nickel ABC transporter permease/ATP-binding protein [Pseudosporangium ferrugineum]PRY21351.1 oligopeptide/dipeptide ABC transporter ATP-binding protein [Pseudosporangium ferrugineum]